jgi:putative component of toxin-antitoxin plasmid stabilization module
MGQMGYQQQQPQTGMQSHIQSQMEMQAHMQWQPHMQPYMQPQLGMGMPLQPHMQPHMQPQLGMGMTFNHMMPELGPQLPHGESPSMTVDTEFVDLESLCADNDWEVHSVERSDMIHPESEINQGSYSHVLFSNVVGQDAIPDEVSEQRAEQVSLQGLQKFAGSNAEECQQKLSEYYDRFQQTHPGLKRLKSREGVLKLRCRGGCGVKITYWRKSGSAHKVNTCSNDALYMFVSER